MLRYRFPKSASKNFADALEFAEGLPGFRQDGEFYWIEFAEDDVPSAEFVALERLSNKWNRSGYYLDDRRVARETWWETTRPIGKPITANTEYDWIESKAWLTWTEPENLVVGESYRQKDLRRLSGAPEDIVTLKPVAVSFQRDPQNEFDKNAVKAVVNGVHVGFLSKETSAIVGPAMDQRRINEMEFAGVISGSDNLGVHVWPNRVLSDSLRISDPSRPILTRYYQEPKEIYERYIQALKHPQTSKVQASEAAASSQNVDRELVSCITSLASLVMIMVGFAIFILFLIVALS